MTEYRVIILPTGAHYDCASLDEANDVFDNAPQSDEETGRQITADGIVIREE